jgi:hypothetical protein
VTQRGQQQIQHAGVFYAEDHSAIRWPYYFHSLLWPLVLVVTVAAAAVTGNPNWAWPIAVGIAGTLLGTGFTSKMWPVGIRVGGDGIRIGGVRGRPRPRKSPPWADYQRRQVLFCPWDAVRRAAVITDKPALRDARSLSRQGVIRLGVLSAPFTRAALLIEVDPDRVVLPEFREQDIDRPFWRPAHMAPVEVSAVWYVPTRHPDALRAALAQQAPSFGDRSDPRLPSHLRLLLEHGDVSRA